VTKTQSSGPTCISCLEHRATRVLHCAIVTRAAVLVFPLLLQTIINNQMRPRRLRGAWFSRLLRHPARRRSGSILSPEPTRGDPMHIQCLHAYIRPLRPISNICPMLLGLVGCGMHGSPDSSLVSHCNISLRFIGL